MEEEEFINDIYSEHISSIASRSASCRYNFRDETLDFYDASGEFLCSYVDSRFDVEEYRDLCFFLAAKFYNVSEKDIPEFFEKFFIQSSQS